LVVKEIEALALRDCINLAKIRVSFQDIRLIEDNFGGNESKVNNPFYKNVKLA